MQILIVDDKVENLYFLEVLLKGYGYNVVSAKNGAEALGFISKSKPDLIISDILMPVMDGYSLCMECKKNEGIKNIPFIFYTATYTDPKDEEFALSLGADRFWLKPIDPDVLIEEIETILSSAEKRTSAGSDEKIYDEHIVLKEYNEALIRKLEDKMADSERSEKELLLKNVALEKEIEERKRAQRIIKEYSANLDSLINNRNELIWSINNDLKIIIANTLYKQFCKEIYLCEVKEDSNALEIFNEEDKKFWQDKYSITLRGKRIWFEFIIEKNSKLDYYEVFLNPIYSNGAITGLSAIGHNITERKHAEMELKAAKEKAEEINRLKSSILANMSHELRTPLMGILGYADILLDEIQNIEQKKMLKDIMDSGKRLSETLQLILDLANTEAKQIKKNEKAVDLDDIIKLCIKRNEDLSLKKNISVKYYNKSISALLDERLLCRILDNILNNAIKYTNKGDVKIETGEEIIDNLRYVYIKVSDTGIGISEKEQEIIFDEFRQASEGWSRNFEGTGLGLTIAKKMTEIMGGLISVESEINKGSTFIVKIPAAVFNKEIAENVTQVNKFLFSNEKNKKILYVEDEEINRSLIKAYLSKNYFIDTVSNGLEALNICDLNNYDLILMDINLGNGMNGLEVTAKLREHPNYIKTPIIAVTAYTMIGDREEFLSKGCSHYLAKPFNRRSLLNLLTEILNN